MPVAMLKAYTYKPSDIGLDAWPPGELRLAGTTEVTPDQATIFICPGPLHMFETVEALDKFPYMRGNETRHVFFDCSDNKTYFTGKSCIFLRCNLMNELKAADPNSIPWAWPVEDYLECMEVPTGGFKYDVSFQGWLSNATREMSVKSISDSQLTSDIATYKDFCGYIYDTPEGVRRRAEFRRSMRESRICLCPESISGVFPYRFFEAMSAGRIPLLVGSNYNLPFAEEIPYEEFCIFQEAADADAVNLTAEGFLEHNSDSDIVERGRIARRFWKLYLNREDWPRTMAYAVRKKLDELRLWDGEVGTI